MYSRAARRRLRVASSSQSNLASHQCPVYCAWPAVITPDRLATLSRVQPMSSVSQKHRAKARQWSKLQNQSGPFVGRAALQHSTILIPRGHHIASCKQAVNTKDYRTAAYEMKLEGRKEAAKSPQWLACCSLAIPAALLCSVVAPIVFSPILSHKAGATQVRLHDSVECLDRLSVFTVLCLTGC